MARIYNCCPAHFDLPVRHVNMSNQFKLPVFRNRNAAAIEGVPTFDIGRLQVNDRIGQGSFGEVFTTDFRFPSEHAAETVVVKKALGK